MIRDPHRPLMGKLNENTVREAQDILVANQPGYGVSRTTRGSHARRSQRRGGGRLKPASFDVIKTEDDKATIRAGFLSIGVQALPVVETIVTIQGGSVSSPHYVFLEHTIGTNSARIIANSTASYPSSSPTVLRKALWAAYAKDDTVILVQDHRNDPLVAWVKV